MFDAHRQGLLVSGDKLPYRAAAEHAAEVGGAVEVTPLVADQPSGGTGPVVRPSEAVQHGERAAPIQCEHRAAAQRAAVAGGAVEVASLVADQPCLGIDPVRLSEA